MRMLTLALPLAVAAALPAGGCGTSAWRLEESRFGVLEPPPRLPAHRAVERVTLRVGGREFEFVGYRTCDPDRREARVQLLLDNGISVLDVAVRDDRDERISGGVFEAIPGLAGIAMADLRRTWGSRSLFASVTSDVGTGVHPIGRDSRVSDGSATYPAEPLDDGSYVAITQSSSDRTVRSVHVTLLGPGLVPEARIEYADFDDDGVPREVRLEDLLDGHTLDVEVEEVLLAPREDA